MPGISLVTSRSPNSMNFDDVLDSLLYFDEYSKQELYADETTKIGSTGYESYPVRSIETESHFILLEGYLYPKSNTKKRVTNVVKYIEQSNSKEIEQWLSSRDGEFILTVVNKQTGEINLLNDALGRLPFYIYSIEDRILISRELGFILDTEEIEMSSMAVAQMLLFGYPLGERTLYKNVRQVAPGSLVTISGGEYSVERVYELRIDRKPYRDRSVEKNASEMAKLFSEACRHRANLGGTNVVSLSGGLDSRAIATAFSTNDLPFVATTYNEADGSRSKEVAVAEEVMTTLDGEWELFNLKPNNGRRMSKLLDIKRGMNPLVMGYILDYLNNIKERYGDDVHYFAGDGGDKIFPGLSTKKFSDSEAVVDHLFVDQNRLNVETVVDLTGHSRHEIETVVLDRIQSYPGNNPTEKYAQFLFWERGGKWVLHGEDRNRYFFWTPAPFYSLPLVKYGMGVPDTQKRRNKLYRAFLNCIEPQIVAVKYANAGASIDSYEYKLKQRAYDLLSRYPALRDPVVSVLKGEVNYKYDETIASVFLSQTDSLNLDYNVISEGKLREIAMNRSDYDRAIYYLLTVVTSLEKLENNRTSLQNHLDDNFQ